MSFFILDFQFFLINFYSLAVTDCVTAVLATYMMSFSQKPFHKFFYAILEVCVWFVAN